MSEDRFIIKTNSELECYQIIDSESDQSHDEDKAKELIADVYREKHAFAIQAFLNGLDAGHKIIKQNTKKGKSETLGE